MAALDFYGLAFDPFDKNVMATRQDFQSHDHKKALEAMTDAASKNGLCVLTSKPGLGKSLVINTFLDSLDPSSHVSGYIAPGLSTTQEFYRLLCAQFKLDPTGNRQRLQNTVKNHLQSCYLRNKPAVIIVDEAHDLRTDTLSELRILRNFERDSLNVFTLILAGESSLANTIQHDEKLEALRQRVTSHYNFTGLTNDEVHAYVAHKLKFAGGSDILIDDEAFKSLCDSTQGISRTIDHVMSDVLKWGIQLKRHTLDTEVIQRAVDSQSLI